MGKKQEVVCMVQWYEVGTKTINVQVEVSPEEVVQGWSVSLDKTTVEPGDTVTLNVTVNWGAPGGVYFKARINAFGQTFESQAVVAQTSPFTFKVPLTVPGNLSEGTYTISVTLLVGVSGGEVPY